MDSRYFATGEVNDEQVTDHAGSKKMDKVEVEKWLGQNLGYEIRQGVNCNYGWSRKGNKDEIGNMSGNLTIIGLLIASSITLSSCSNDSSGGGINPASINVAQGSTVTSNINTGGTEVYVNDGDTSTTNSWHATLDGDYLLIEFSGPRIIESVDIVASSINDYADFSMEISSDNVFYSALDNQTSCSSYSLTASGYGCQFVTSQDALYFRFRILNNLNTPQIHEIVLMGTAPLS